MAYTGIYYIATGRQFVREAEISAKYVRKSMPNTPIAIATDVTPTFNFDHVLEVPNASHSFVDQINNIHRSPFDMTLNIDTDIYISSDVSELFELLNNFDIAVAYNHNREAYDVQGVPESFPEFNTGVIAYRNNSQINSFFKKWKKQYTKMKCDDNTQNQPAFRKVLYSSNIRVSPLTPEYNCMIRYPGHVRKEVKVAHSRLIDLNTPGSEKLLDVAGSVNKMNSFIGHRLYVPCEDEVEIRFGYKSKRPNIYKRFVNSAKARGLKATLKRSIRLASETLKSLMW